MKRYPKRNGFTVLEIMMATVIIVFTAAGTFLLLGSASQFMGRRGHQYEAFEYGIQTLDTLKDYVTPIATGDPGSITYHLQGDGAANFVALDPGPPSPHQHDLPAGVLRDQLGGLRTYTVEDVDLDGDGNYDYKQVTVTVQWTEPQ